MAHSFRPMLAGFELEVVDQLEHDRLDGLRRLGKWLMIRHLARQHAPRRRAQR